MKRLLISILCLCICFYTNAQTFKSAGDYYEYIGDLFHKVNEKVQQTQISYVQSSSKEAVEKARKEYVDVLKSTISTIKALPGYAGNTSYRDNVAAHLDESLRNLMLTNAELVKVENSTEEADYVRFLQLIDKLDAQSDETYKKVEMSSDSFAKKQGFTLVDTETEFEKKNKIISKVNRYDRLFTISYNRIEKMRSGFSDAIEKKDFEKGAALRKKVIAFSKLTIDKLQLIGPFMKDDTYQKAGIEYFTKCMNGAEKEFGKALGYIKTTEMTQEKVTLFNQYIDDHNLMIDVSKAFVEKRKAFMKTYYPK
jgi:hypothetical protein